jgi:hypothetical protein
LPGLSDYSLRGLATLLGIDFPVRHRALADADATRAVFLALRERLSALPAWLLEQVERLALAGGWSLASVVADVLAEGGGLRTGAAGLVVDDVLARPEEIAKPLQALAGGRETGEQEVVRVLSAAGRLREQFAEFERRPQQEDMAAAVAAALRDSPTCCRRRCMRCARASAWWSRLTRSACRSSFSRKTFL